jgi:hypothetical protein
VLSSSQGTNAVRDRVEYYRPSPWAIGRVTTGVVVGLVYVLMAVDGLSIALFGLASLLSLVLTLVRWFIGIS